MELQEKAKNLFEFFDTKDDGYYVHGQGMRERMFEVNVKLGSLYNDINNSIARHPVRFKKRIKEEFTEERINGVYDQWIEDERQQLYDVFLFQGQQQAMSKEEWDKLAGSKIETGINDLKTKKAKEKKLAEFIATDKKMLDAFSIVAVKIKENNTVDHRFVITGLSKTQIALKIRALEKLGYTYDRHGTEVMTMNKKETTRETSAGFYGRMGGHFCFDIDYSTDDLEGIIDNEVSEEEAEEIIKEAEMFRDRVAYLKEYVRKAKSGLNFQQNLDFRVEEYVDELRTEEKENNRIKKEAQHKTPNATMTSTLADMLLSKNEQIKRLAKGIYKEITK